MAREGGSDGGLLVFLSVGCAISVQLFLVHQSALLVHLTAAFPVLAAHIAGWGIGLGLQRRVSGTLGAPVVLSAAAAGAAGIGTWIATAPQTRLAAELGSGALVPVALGSGALSGLAIAFALSRCTRPTVALLADLAGVGAGAASHVGLMTWVPGMPVPLVWTTLLVVKGFRDDPLRALLALGLAAALALPLDRPERLAEGATPLGRALRERGLQAWKGSFHDPDGRVDAVFDSRDGGVELFINGGTQAKTPAAGKDRITHEILALVRPESALVLGAGGLADVAMLLEGGVDRVVAVERAPAVLRAAHATSPDARRLFGDPRVDVVRGEARRFVGQVEEAYDLVFLPLAYGSAGASPAALLFLPSYLYTIEGLALQSRAAASRGAVCFILPTADLRDRLLATIAAVERRASGSELLTRRLWIVRDPRAKAYTEGICWAPHSELPTIAPAPAVQVLHLPGHSVSGPLRARLEARGTAPPVEDWRPYFFDLFSRFESGETPRFLLRLFGWTLVGMLLLGLLFARRSRPVSRALGMPALAVAALTGAAFPALEYVVLSIARGSGHSDGIAFAALGGVFAVGGILATLVRIEVPRRALLGALVMLAAAMILHQGGLTYLLSMPSHSATLMGAVAMLAVMVAGVAAFAGLFRDAERHMAQPGEVRHLFVASALGTLTSTAPVLVVELRWGAPGCALAAAFAYVLAAGIACMSSRRTSFRT